MHFKIIDLFCDSESDGIFLQDFFQSNLLANRNNLLYERQ